MKNILIVVDMQNGFNRYEQTQILADKIIKLTNDKLFDKIIATRFLNKEGSQYTKFLNWHRLMCSTDIDLIEGIRYDYVIDKWVYTCVNEDFMNLLCNINEGELPKHIFICGADTDCCVLKIATDLFEKDVMPIVLTNYCDSNGGKSSHESGIHVMERLIGRKSLVPDEILNHSQIDNILNERQYS